MENKNIEFDDVAELFNKICKFHPNMFFKISQPEFNKELRKVREFWNDLDFFQKYFEIMRLNAQIGDLHTKITTNFFNV